MLLQPHVLQEEQAFRTKPHSSASKEQESSWPTPWMLLPSLQPSTPSAQTLQNSVCAEFDKLNHKQSPTESTTDFPTALLTLLIDCDTESMSSDGAIAKKIGDNKLDMQHATRTPLAAHAREATPRDNPFRILQADESAAETSFAIRNQPLAQHCVAALSKPQSPLRIVLVSRTTANLALVATRQATNQSPRMPCIRKSVQHLQKQNHFAWQCLGKRKHAVNTLSWMNCAQYPTSLR